MKKHVGKSVLIWLIVALLFAGCASTQRAVPILVGKWTKSGPGNLLIIYTFSDNGNCVLEVNVAGTTSFSYGRYVIKENTIRIVYSNYTFIDAKGNESRSSSSEEKILNIVKLTEASLSFWVSDSSDASKVVTFSKS